MSSLQGGTRHRRSQPSKGATTGLLPGYWVLLYWVLLLGGADQVLDDVGDFADLEGAVDDDHGAEEAAGGRVAFVLVGDEDDLGRDLAGPQVLEEAVHALRAEVRGEGDDVVVPDLQAVARVADVGP